MINLNFNRKNNLHFYNRIVKHHHGITALLIKFIIYWLLSSAHTLHRMKVWSAHTSWPCLGTYGFGHMWPLHSPPASRHICGDTSEPKEAKLPNHTPWHILINLRKRETNINHILRFLLLAMIQPWTPAPLSPWTPEPHEPLNLWTPESLNVSGVHELLKPWAPEPLNPWTPAPHELLNLWTREPLDIWHRKGLIVSFLAFTMSNLIYCGQYYLICRLCIKGRTN